jgi:hypothetical protein
MLESQTTPVPTADAAACRLLSSAGVRAARLARTSARTAMHLIPCSVDVPMLDLLDGLRARPSTRTYHVRHDSVRRGQKRAMSHVEPAVPCKRARRVQVAGWKRTGDFMTGCDVEVAHVGDAGRKRARVCGGDGVAGRSGWDSGSSGWFRGGFDTWVEADKATTTVAETTAAVAAAAGCMYGEGDVEGIVDCAATEDVDGMLEDERQTSCEAMVLEGGKVLVRVTHGDGTVQCICVEKPPS